jgi:Lon protease-like protein
MSNTRIPLFPLNVVMLPTMELSLHIFEERYKAMIQECLQGNSEFGIVYYNGSGIFPVGCTAGVEKVLKMYEDGRMDILTRGERRFHIEQVLQEKSFLEATVTFFSDYEAEKEGEMNELIQVGMEYLDKISEVTGRQYDQDAGLEAEKLSFSLISVQDINNEDLQMLLEMTSTRKRLERDIQLLSRRFHRLKVKNELKRLFKSPRDLWDEERM